MRILKVNQITGEHSALCTDISRGGIGFESAIRLELGSAIEYAFAFVGDHPFRHSCPYSLPHRQSLRSILAGRRRDCVG